MDYFLHIPKTAGTALTHFIDQFYKPEEIFPYQIWNDTLKNWPIDVSNYKLIRGHFGYCAHYIFGAQNINYFTVIRNPVERTISQYHHMTQDRIYNNWVYNFPYSHIGKLLFKQPWVVSNIQVKHLAYNENIFDMKPNLPYIFLENYEEKDMEGLFKKACDNLDKFFFVGIFEKMEQSVDRLCQAMNWPRAKLFRKNVLRNRPAVNNFTRSIIKRIEQVNEWDFKLYDYAVNRYGL